MVDKPTSSGGENKFVMRWRQILEAAAGLFAKKGFHRTTTKEIAEAADVSEGTLYNYFKNKNDILMGILQNLIEKQKLARSMEISLPINEREFFSVYFREQRKQLDQNFDMAQSVLSAILDDQELRERYYRQLLEPTMKNLERQMDMRIKLGQIKETDPELLARFFTSFTLGTFLLQVVDDPVIEDQWDAFIKLSETIFFDGISSR